MESFKQQYRTSALDLINAGTGLLGVGITWEPYVEFVPGTTPHVNPIVFNAAPKLILNAEHPAPLPATTWLLVAGLLGLAVKRKSA